MSQFFDHNLSSHLSHVFVPHTLTQAGMADEDATYGPSGAGTEAVPDPSVYMYGPAGLFERLNQGQSQAIGIPRSIDAGLRCIVSLTLCNIVTDHIVTDHVASSCFCPSFRRVSPHPKRLSDLGSHPLNTHTISPYSAEDRTKAKGSVHIVLHTFNRKLNRKLNRKRSWPTLTL